MLKMIIIINNFTLYQRLFKTWKFSIIMLITIDYIVSISKESIKYICNFLQWFISMFFFLTGNYYIVWICELYCELFNNKKKWVNKFSSWKRLRATFAMKYIFACHSLWLISIETFIICKTEACSNYL